MQSHNELMKGSLSLSVFVHCDFVSPISYTVSLCVYICCHTIRITLLEQCDYTFGDEVSSLTV